MWHPSCTNKLCASHIVLDDEKALPTGAMDIGDGFAFLRVRDETPYNMSAAEAEALRVHWEQ